MPKSNMREPLTERNDGGNGKRKIVRTYGRNRVKGTVLQENNLDIFLNGDGLENAFSKLRIDGRRISSATKRPKKQHSFSEKSSHNNISDPSKLQAPQSEQSQPDQDDAQPDEMWLRPLLELSDRAAMRFSTYAGKLSKAYNLQKIGEGSFSSVFSLSEKDSDIDMRERSIIKIIPIRAPSSSDEGDQSDIGSIVNELQTMSVLDAVPGFLRYRGVVVLRGSWPPIFLEAFRAYRKRCRSKALNEDPAEAYADSQYYAVIEMGCAGQELDGISRPSDFQIFDVFWMTAINLALAEERLEFEHRDLHVSNICVKAADSTEARIDVLSETVKSMTERPRILLGLTNIDLTLIDYTYSRTVQSAESAEVEKEHEEDSEEGSNTDEKKRKEEVLQQSTYAKANECIAAKRAEQGLSKGDPVFAARTNVCWLSYLIYVLLGRAGKIARTKYVQGSNAIAKGVQDEIRGKAMDIAQSLSRTNVDELPSSALEVLNIGLEKGWLSKLDVEAFRLRLEAYDHS